MSTAVPVKSKKSEASKLNEVERKMIIEAYNRHKSSYKVAEELGISQSSAYRKIQKYIKKT